MTRNWLALAFFVLVAERQIHGMQLLNQSELNTGKELATFTCYNKLPKDLKYEIITKIITAPDFGTAARQAKALACSNPETRILVIEMLIKKLNLPNDPELIPEHIQRKFLEVVKAGTLSPLGLYILQKLGADPLLHTKNINHRDTILSYAASCPPLTLALVKNGGDPVTVQLLLEAGLDPNTHRNGKFPLEHAVEEGNVKVTKLLLNHGACLEKCKIEGKSLLLYALIKKFSDIVVLLLDHGADPKTLPPQTYISYCGREIRNPDWEIQ